jgi:ABC-type multidrug transport system fused ATPase/permease subunit
MTKNIYLYSKSVFKEFIDLFKVFLELKKKKSLFFLFFVSIIVIFFEGYTLAIVYSLSNLMVDANFESSNFLLMWISNKFDTNNLEASLIAIVSLLLFIFVKNIISLFIIFYKNNFFIKLHFKISQKMFESFISQDYQFFIGRNSSKLISTFTQDIALTMRGFVAMFNIMIEFLMILGIFSYLVYMDKMVALIFFIGGGIFFICHTFFTKKKLIKLSNQRMILNEEIIKNLQQAFSSFRELIIYSAQKIFSQSIKIKYQKYFMNMKINNLLQETARVLIEQIFIIFIMLAFLFMNYFLSKSILEIIPIFAVYLFAFLRILPSLNKLIIETQSYLYGKLFIKKTHLNLNLGNKNIKKITKVNLFDKEINFKNVSYAHNGMNEDILNNIDFKIIKKQKIGIMGESGSGKTTLLNLIMGFLAPKKGEITIDNVNLKNHLINWQSLIAYVPQTVAILDDTLKLNITFESDDDKIDYNKLKQAIKISGLDKFILNNNQSYEIIIGEKGSKISGGEILRVSLARAIYSNAEILILDEFTSALDNETEERIIDSLKNIDKTVIIVSHRRSTLKYCDKIFKLTKNQLTTT